MKSKNNIIKILVSLILIASVGVFHSYLKDMMGEKLILLTTPLVLSFFYLILDFKASTISFFYRVLIFVALFGGVFYAFNYNNSSFQKVDFALALGITVACLIVQEKLFPSNNSAIKTITDSQ